LIKDVGLEKAPDVALCPDMKKELIEKENIISVLKLKLECESQASEVLEKALVSIVASVEKLKGDAERGLLGNPTVLTKKLTELQIAAMKHTGPQTSKICDSSVIP